MRIPFLAAGLRLYENASETAKVSVSSQNLHSISPFVYEYHCKAYSITFRNYYKLLGDVDYEYYIAGGKRADIKLTQP